MGKYADENAFGACTDCEANKYCPWEALNSSERVDCPNGFDCKVGTPMQYPNWIETESANYHLCNKGYYCA